jgi:hypothetical protein
MPVSIELLLSFQFSTSILAVYMNPKEEDSKKIESYYDFKFCLHFYI